MLDAEDERERESITGKWSFEDEFPVIVVVEEFV